MITALTFGFRISSQSGNLLGDDLKKLLLENRETEQDSTMEMTVEARKIRWSDLQTQAAVN